MGASLWRWPHWLSGEAAMVLAVFSSPQRPSSVIKA